MLKVVISSRSWNSLWHLLKHEAINAAAPNFAIGLPISEATQKNLEPDPESSDSTEGHSVVSLLEIGVA